MHILKNILCFFFISFISISQEKYDKNDHVEIDNYVENNHYVIDYTFKDHKNHLHQFRMKLNKPETDLMIKKFGVPTSMGPPPKSNKNYKSFDYETLLERNQIIEDAMFIANEGYVEQTNKKALVSYYKETVVQIADYIVDYLSNNQEDTRSNRIEMAIKFVQDIPYAIPKENRRVFKWGYITPPEVLIEGYGDCDSKTILFVCVMSYLIPEDDILFVSTPRHIFSAIKDESFNGLCDEEYVPYTQRDVSDLRDGGFVEYNSSRYFVCETAGPGRSDYGQSYQYQSANNVASGGSFFKSLKNILKYTPAPSIYRPTSKIKHCKIETFDLSELVVFPGTCYHSITSINNNKLGHFDYHSCFMFNPPSSDPDE